MTGKKLSRRDMLKLIGTTTATGAVLAACSGAVPQAAAPAATAVPETKKEEPPQRLRRPDRPRSS